MLRINDGFSLIEAVIALLVLSVAIIGIASMQSFFALNTVDRVVFNCLTDAASSALSSCQAGVDPSTSFTCPENNINISISKTGNCTPPTNECSDITVIATYGVSNSKFSEFRLSTKVCNPQ